MNYFKEQKKLKQLLIEEIETITTGHNDVGLFLSSGIDSSSIAIALKELNKSVTAYNFHIKTKNSKDHWLSLATAKNLGLNYIDIELPEKVRVKYIRQLMQEYGLVKKTDIECLYPLLHSRPYIQQKVVLSGFGSDTYFLNTRRASIEYSSTLELSNEYRNSVFCSGYYNPQMVKLIQMYADAGIRIDSPFMKEKVFNFFSQWKAQELNLYGKKSLLWDAFDARGFIKKTSSQSLQGGDTGIRESFTTLLNSNLNIKKRKSMVHFYKDLQAHYCS